MMQSDISVVFYLNHEIHLLEKQLDKRVKYSKLSQLLYRKLGDCAYSFLLIWTPIGVWPLKLNENSDWN